jgi:hypothetical protein
MKKGTIIAGTILMLGVGTVLKAQDTNRDVTVVHDDNPLRLYRDQEFTVDFFGGGTLDEHDVNHVNGSRIREDGRLGLGGGGSFFFVRNLGIEGEVYTENPQGHFIDETSGSLVLRVPLGEGGLAPYIFGGGGHLFDPVPSNFGQAGAGLEYRFSPHFGVFVDGRWVITEDIGNYGMGRAGLRLAF